MIIIYTQAVIKKEYKKVYKTFYLKNKRICRGIKTKKGCKQGQGYILATNTTNTVYTTLH